MQQLLVTPDKLQDVQACHVSLLQLWHRHASGLSDTCVVCRYVRQDSHLWSVLHDGMLTTGEEQAHVAMLVSSQQF